MAAEVRAFNKHHGELRVDPNIPQGLSACLDGSAAAAARARFSGLVQQEMETASGLQWDEAAQILKLPGCPLCTRDAAAAAKSAATSAETAADSSAQQPEHAASSAWDRTNMVCALHSSNPVAWSSYRVARSVGSLPCLCWLIALPPHLPGTPDRARASARAPSSARRQHGGACQRGTCASSHKTLDLVALLS